MLRARLFSIATAVLLGAAVAPSCAAPVLEPPLHQFAGVAISPDATRLGAVESDQPADDTKAARETLVVRKRDGSSPRIVAACTDASCTYEAPVWSPDSSLLAFVAGGKRHGALELADADGSHVRTLLSFDGTLHDVRFSRDGRTLAVLATAGARKEVGATQAGAPLTGEIGTSADEQRIATLPVSGGDLHFVSPPNLYVYEYDWTPSGDFVGTAAPGNGDDNWWVAKLTGFDGRTGDARVLYAPPTPQTQLADPRVSPDGKLVAFVAGIMSDFGSTGGDVEALDLTQPAAVPMNVTATLPLSATSLVWNCTRDRLFFGDVRGPATEISSVAFPAFDPASDGAGTPSPAGASPAFFSPPRVLWSERWSLAARDGAFAMACDAGPGGAGSVAFARQTFDRAPEIDVGPIAAPRDVTRANAGLAAEAHARSIQWKDDGFDVAGWLLTPAHAGDARKAPLVTVVHGGPAAAFEPRFVSRGTVRDLLRHGYDVFEPNPRGSFGQGEAFTLANVKDFGYGDLRDILSGIDAVERIASIDDGRLGLTGGSYGGFMTMWAITQTQRFKAAVAGAGVSDWISYYGENGIDEWMLPYFGASAYADPAAYRRSSPIEFITHARTPTFAYVGELDVECPAPQSVEFWHALETLGVPVSLVVYPGEGHRVRQPEHQHDITRRTLAWFDRYLR